jgi:hypothetical protein
MPTTDKSSTAMPKSELGNTRASTALRLKEIKTRPLDPVSIQVKPRKATEPPFEARTSVSRG